jgi:collagenase-like PrtC family protease
MVFYQLSIEVEHKVFPTEHLRYPSQDGRCLTSSFSQATSMVVGRCCGRHYLLLQSTTTHNQRTEAASNATILAPNFAHDYHHQAAYRHEFASKRWPLHYIANIAIGEVQPRDEHRAPILYQSR